jgi:uncharacterized protein YfaS (alpha-2-macroglobulin family)
MTAQKNAVRLLTLGLVLLLLVACSESETSPETLAPTSAPVATLSASASVAPVSVAPVSVAAVASAVDDAIERILEAEAASRLDTAGSPQDLPPHVRFQSGGYVLARESALGIEVVTVNVDELRLELIRVPEEHIGVFLNSVGNLDTTSVSGYGLLERLERDAVVVWSGTVAVPNVPNAASSTLLPMHSVIADLPPGLFALVVGNRADASALMPTEADRFENTDGLWRREAPLKWILSTNIAISAAQHEKGMLVNLRALDSGEPLEAVETRLITRNNEVVFAGTSDAAGWVEVPEPAVRGRRAHQPAYLMVHSEGDFAFLRLDAASLDLSRFPIGGRVLAERADAYLFTDRGIYRPREVVHVHALVRDHDGRDTVQAAFELVVRRPNGSEFLRQRVQLGNLGSLHERLQLPADAPRGVWRIALGFPGEDRVAGQIEIDVQDFLPERLKVEMTGGPALATLGEMAEFPLRADYLYGAPAQGLGVEADAFLEVAEGGEVPLPRWDGFVFGDVLQPIGMQRLDAEVEPTDAEGMSSVLVAAQSPGFPQLASGPVASQPLRLTLAVGVQEPGGRTSRARTTVLMASPLPALALRPQFGDQISADANATFEVRVLSPTLSELPVTGLRWQLQRSSVLWDYDRSTQRWRSREVLNPRIRAEGAVSAVQQDPNLGLVEVPAQDWGRYVLTVIDDDQRVYVRHAYRSGWSSNAGSDAPDFLELQASQPQFTPGDRVTVGIDAPFAGQGTLTVWTDRPVYSRSIRFDAGRNVFELPSSDAWTPGVYVVVNAIRGLGDRPAAAATHSLSIERYLPVRSMGVLYLRAETGRRLAVALPQERRLTPRGSERLEIAVPQLAGQRAYAVVQAVDEGILQLTRFRTPDPAAHFFGKRRLTVEFFDAYNRLIRGDGEVGELRTGGDAAASIGGVALEAIPTRSVVLHAGPVALDADGYAEIDLAVPDFNGRLRTMVTVWSDDAFGSAEGFWTVRDPLVAEAILPRFLSPGDSAIATLMLANTTDETLEAELVVRGQGAVGASLAGDASLGGDASPAGGEALAVDASLAGDASTPESVRGARSGGEPIADGALTRQRITLDAGENRRLTLPIQGTALGVGEVHLELFVEGQPGIQRHWPLTVQYPGALLAYQSEPEVIAPGEEVSLSLAFAAEAQEAGSRGRIIVQRGVGLLHPDYATATLLAELLRYRWTCSEQTASQFTPILAVYQADPEFALRMTRETLQGHDLEDWLQEKVDRILARQGPDGAIGLWTQGDDLVDPAMAAQLIEMLARARSAQLQVPESALLSGFSWALRLVNQMSETEKLRDRSLARMLNAMAPHSPRSVRLARALADTTARTDALMVSDLALALRQFGDESRAAQLVTALAQLALDPSTENGPYHVSAQGELAQLAANVYALGSRSQADALLVELDRQLAALDYPALSINTQGHLLLAQVAAIGQAPIEVELNGRLHRSLLGSVVIPLDDWDLAPDQAPDEAPGQAPDQASLTLRSNSEQALTATVQVHAAPKPGTSLVARGSGLAIARRVCRLDGAWYPEGLNEAEVNERFVVLLKVDTEALAGRGPRQLMVVDPVPAGFQVESIIRSHQGPVQFPWLPSLSEADALEAQDVGFFAARLTEAPHRGYWSYNRWGTELNYAYVVRATTPGVYLANQAVVEDMYDPATYASSGGHPVRVWPVDATGRPARAVDAIRGCGVPD